MEPFFNCIFSSSTTLSSVSLSPIQICCQRWSLLRNACCQEETYITEEEGGTTVDYSLHSLPVFLFPSHLSFQHWTHVFIPAPHYLFIRFVTPLSPSPNTFSLWHEDSLLSCLPDSWKPHSERGCLFLSQLLHYCCYTQPDTLQPEHTACPSSHRIPLSFSI